MLLGWAAAFLSHTAITSQFAKRVDVVIMGIPT